MSSPRLTEPFVTAAGLRWLGCAAGLDDVTGLDAAVGLDVVPSPETFDGLEDVAGLVAVVGFVTLLPDGRPDSEPAIGGTGFLVTASALPNSEPECTLRAEGAAFTAELLLWVRRSVLLAGPDEDALLLSVSLTAVLLLLPKPLLVDVPLPNTFPEVVLFLEP